MSLTTIEYKTIELRKDGVLRIVRVGSKQEQYWRSEGFIAEGEEKPVVKKTTRRKKSEKAEVVTEEVTEN